MGNAWISTNEKTISMILHLLAECEYRPEFDNFPLRVIQKIIVGAKEEILRLQRELDSLKKENNEKEDAQT